MIVIEVDDLTFGVLERLQNSADEYGVGYIDRTVETTDQDTKERLDGVLDFLIEHGFITIRGNLYIIEKDCPENAKLH
jgi:hypothetical protein